MIFNQTIASPKIAREEEPKCRNYCFFKFFIKCKCFGFCKSIADFCDFFCECLTLLLISFRDCIKNAFCFYCNTICRQNCCNCECCFDSTCCCCDNNSFKQKEISVCLCYQEKRKSEWFREFLNNDTQKAIIQIVFLMAFFESFIIGLEEIYDEKNEKDNNKENMALPLLYSFLFYILFPIIFYFISPSCIECINKKMLKDNAEHEPLPSFQKAEDIFRRLSILIVIGTLIFIIPTNSIASFIFSILYFKNKNSLFEKKEIFIPVYFHKYTIFTLSYLSQSVDEDNELLSSSSLISVYLYIFDLVISGIKQLLPLTGLMVIQILFSSLLVLIEGCGLLGLLCLLIINCNDEKS